MKKSHVRLVSLIDQEQITLNHPLTNKTDLAPYVGANLDRMREDTLHFRNEDSFIFTNLNNDDNVKEVEEWIRKNFLLEDL